MTYWASSPAPGALPFTNVTAPTSGGKTNRSDLSPVDWGRAKELYPVRITMVAYDRVGLLNDLTRNVSEEGVNIVIGEHRRIPGR